MLLTLRIKIILWSFWFAVRVMCYFFQNLCVWLLGLQPGLAHASHLTSSAQTNVVRPCRFRDLRRRRRRRPASRTPRHRLMKWFRRHLLPNIVRDVWIGVRHVVSAAWLARSEHRVQASSNPTLLSRPVVRCTPCVLQFDRTGLHELSQEELNARVLSCLLKWCSALDISARRLQQCKSAIAAAKPGIATRMPDARSSDIMLTLAACVACLVESKASTWEHIQSLSVVLEALAAWIFPPNLRTKKCTSLTTDFVFLACGSLKLALVTDWQSRGGHRKRKRAVRRCLGLEPILFNASLGPRVWTTEHKAAFARFLSLQVFAVLCEQRTHAVLYQLSSPYVNYLGSTKFDVKRFGCAGSSPTMRSYQHILEDCGRSCKAKSKMQCTRKCRMFKNVRISNHMFWVLAQGSETYIRCLEEAGISCWRPEGNSRSVGSKYVRKARKSQAARMNRARPKERIPPADVDTQTTCFEQWLRRGACLHSLHRARPQRMPLRSQRDAIHNVGFATGYGLALQCMLLQGWGYGPVDIANPCFSALLTRYIADASYVDWDSLHQRLGSLRRDGRADAAARAVSLAKHVRRMPRANAKARASARMSLHLLGFGLAPLRLVYVCWPGELPLWTFWQVVSCLRRQAAATANVWAQWLAILVHPVKSRRRTFADRWGFISVAKGFGRLYASSNLAKLKPTARECSRMRRIKLHRRIPVAHSKKQVLSEACRTVCWLANKMQVSPPLNLCSKFVESNSRVVSPSQLMRNTNSCCLSLCLPKF